ncbi:PRC-barrel domain-containing protein [Rubellimicrobium aerolatum]|uniref:PRC-barrel domain-containing protein n=1 Tax=Rubellimicrobium aerolatum TaxID=490979 RepID=A0ABW0SFX4_9RHOB|nr:PRC-barrel domain-containing protein [Rubellimicrobium aerolatum]MBP1806386.1 hypothetical protein [Rubellimicrobium aerolatum]
MADREPLQGRVISSDRVEGAAVFDLGGQRLGAIDHLLVDRRSGRITHAVMAFGGLLGLGQDLHPIPWAALRYDAALGGYATDLAGSRLHPGPPSSGDGPGDRRWEAQAYVPDGLPFYWV